MTGIQTKEQISIFDKFSIANHANEQSDDINDSYWPALYDLMKDDDVSSSVIVFTDVVYSLVFIICLVIMNRKFTHQIDSAEYELTFMNDYAVEVTGIPKSGFTDKQLKSFLESFGGKIVELSYGYYFDGMLNDYKKLDGVNKSIRELEIQLKIKAKSLGNQPNYFRDNSIKLEKLYLNQAIIKKRISVKYPKIKNVSKHDKI